VFDAVPEEGIEVDEVDLLLIKNGFRWLFRLFFLIAPEEEALLTSAGLAAGAGGGATGEGGGIGGLLRLGKHIFVLLLHFFN
jgi:hypothetical protein|tara:strand:+ start:182 stop:427 length:246 start_codon:yes stop_codon:yes gene_type:complete